MYDLNQRTEANTADMSTSLNRYDVTISRPSFSFGRASTAAPHLPSKTFFLNNNRIRNQPNPFKIKKGKEEIAARAHESNRFVGYLSRSKTCISRPSSNTAPRMTSLCASMTPSNGQASFGTHGWTNAGHTATHGGISDRMQLLTGIA